MCTGVYLYWLFFTEPCGGRAAEMKVDLLLTDRHQPVGHALDHYSVPTKDPPSNCLISDGITVLERTNEPVCGVFKDNTTL